MYSDSLPSVQLGFDPTNQYFEDDLPKIDSKQEELKWQITMEVNDHLKGIMDDNHAYLIHGKKDVGKTYFTK